MFVDLYNITGRHKSEDNFYKNVTYQFLSQKQPGNEHANRRVKERGQQTENGILR
jgi:hypothetical protein